MAITQEEITAAQEEWGQGIVEIGDAFTKGGDYKQRAIEHLKKLYAFDDHEVLFKPTKCEHKQFRPKFDGALSYFVSGNDDFPEDKGFAIAPFVKVRFENANTLIQGSMALSMGNYYFTSPDGTETKVEYSFGYLKSDEGLKIVLHHSSLPFKAG